jgi:hypothetical protein
MRRVIFAVSMGMIFAVGCADKAQPDYAKCVAAEAAGDLAGAQAGCADAIKADPDSKSGRDAAQKLIAALSKERDGVKADLASTNSKLSTTAATLTDTQSKLTAANAEIAKLQETAQYGYEHALGVAGSNTDGDDQSAITELQGVAERYPSDPLMPSVKAKIKEFQRRITKRAADLQAAQAQVRSLIATCQSNAASAKTAGSDSIVFNMFGQIDMNSAMAGSRRSDAYKKRADAAKEKATELVKTVPDTNGSLAEAVEKCDG